jgi:hypothetical protein
MMMMRLRVGCRSSSSCVLGSRDRVYRKGRTGEVFARTVAGLLTLPTRVQRAPRPAARIAHTPCAVTQRGTSTAPSTYARHLTDARKRRCFGNVGPVLATHDCDARRAAGRAPPRAPLGAGGRVAPQVPAGPADGARRQVAGGPDRCPEGVGVGRTGAAQAAARARPRAPAARGGGRGAGGECRLREEARGEAGEREAGAVPPRAELAPPGRGPRPPGGARRGADAGGRGGGGARAGHAGDRGARHRARDAGRRARAGRGPPLRPVVRGRAPARGGAAAA